MKKTSNKDYIRRQFFVSREQADFLRETAHKDNLSQARIIRDAIRLWAKTKKKVALQPEPETML